MPKKKIEIRPFYNPLFTVEHLRVLWREALGHKQQVEQWARQEDYDRAAEYMSKLIALVAVMENITVYNVGGGLNGFGVNPDLKVAHSPLQRLKSFALLFDKEK